MTGILQEMVRMVGQLGGFVNRSIDAMPGVETIWKGLQRLHDMALCWDAFGPTHSGELKKMCGTTRATPRAVSYREFQALKGRHYSCEHFRTAPSGLRIL